MRSSAQIDSTLAALADPERRHAVDLLARKPRSAGELAELLGTTPPQMSRHLRALRTSGLVEERHDGLDARVRIYSLKVEAMSDLKQWLGDIEALWSRQLLSFKAHVEQRRQQRR